jgi:flagellar biogenesis protein FliO
MTVARPFITGLALALPQLAWAGSLAEGAGVAISVWRVVGSLLLCLALGVTAIFLLRRHYGLGQARPLRVSGSRRIRIIEQQGLGSQRSLSLIEIDRRTYAALIAPGAVTLLPLDAPSAELLATNPDQGAS